MHKTFIYILLFLTFLLLLQPSSFSYAAKGDEDASYSQVSYNPRDDYRFGVGSVVGGPFGVIGIVGDMNWYSTINAEIGVGTGIYYDSYVLQGRYLILDHPFTPYAGAGLAYWSSNQSNGPKTAQNSSSAVKLGLVKQDGSNLKSGILILPVSLGIHYISDLGLSLYAEVDFLVSTANANGTPYGALGFQWYF
ncbi:MAG: hypothetical protein HYW85_04510 [Deltaproteobacteria bacterium]|nr:hypothetical protein [Deltaproteobacteria bacterium]MBI3016602.1 hypothetical protein [Deltaproteobacteria bacterium]